MGVRVYINSWEEDGSRLKAFEYSSADNWKIEFKELTPPTADYPATIFQQLEVIDTDNDRIVAAFKSWEMVEVIDNDEEDEDSQGL